MEVYDIVDIINKVTKEENKGHYVLHRSMEVQQMKAYKKFSYTLYLVEGGNKSRVLTYQKIVRLISQIEIERVWEMEDRAFTEHLLTWFKYGKLKDESISNPNN